MNLKININFNTKSLDIIFYDKKIIKSKLILQNKAVTHILINEYSWNNEWFFILNKKLRIIDSQLNLIYDTNKEKILFYMCDKIILSLFVNKNNYKDKIKCRKIWQILLENGFVINKN